MRQCLLLVVLLITVGYCALAQGSCWDCNLDSLKKQLLVKKTDKERFELLQLLIDFDPLGTSQGPDVLSRYNELVELNNKLRLIDITPYIKLREARLLDEKKEYAKALDLYNQAIDLFDQQKKLIYWLLWQPRYFYTKMNKPVEVYHYYKKKLEYYLVNGPIENTAACYESLGRYYSGKADYNQSIGNFLKGAEVARSYSNKIYAILMINVATNYQRWGNEDKFLHYARLILPLALAVKPRMPVAYQLAIAVNKGKKDLQTALRYADEAIEQSLHVDRSASFFFNGLVRDYTNKADLYLHMLQPLLAYPYLMNASQYIDSAQNRTKQLESFPETEFAWYLYNVQTKRLADAENHLLKAYQASLTSTNSTFLHLKYSKELFQFYKSKKPLIARQYADRYMQLRDSLDQKQNVYKIAQYEGEQKEREQSERIAVLKQERLVQEAELGQRKKIIWISLSAFVLVSASLLFLYRQLRTNKRTLKALRETQAQLIHAEKMASLGELTAGIAHEIQNPLNFVNNFSETNLELIEELEQANERGEQAEIRMLAADIKANEGKIAFHGKRADSIVKGMLQHARMGTGRKESTDINQLANEYLRLSYQKFRDKDKAFHANIKTRFDTGIGAASVVPQELGTVLANLFDNAFYSVSEKKQQLNGTFEPTVLITTKREGEQVIITVKDNGTGMSQKVAEKVFQPFFTTKPTGEGVGLGLSLSYDVITKGHGGAIKVETKQGEGSLFTIHLPLN